SDVEFSDTRLLQGVQVVFRVEAEEQTLLPDAHAHVATQQEAKAAEQRLLGEALLADEGLANACGQSFVEGHKSPPPVCFYSWPRASSTAVSICKSDSTILASSANCSSDMSPS